MDNNNNEGDHKYTNTDIKEEKEFYYRYKN